MYSRSRRFVGSPAFAAVTAAAAAVVGLLGSVYQREIAAAFPLTPLGPFEVVSWRAVFFWAALSGLAWLVYLRQRVDDEVRTGLVNSTGNVEQTSRRIEEFVQTLPPRAFQTELARAVAEVHYAVSSAMPRVAGPTLSEEELVHVIRGTLHAIASLALVYDDQPLMDGQRARYCANVMLFVPSGPELDNVEIQFFAAESDRRQLRGVLRLRTDLSSTSDPGDGHAPDANVPDLNLPVPLAAERNRRKGALPGAPFAFLTRNAAGYNDTQTIVEWCRDQGDFLPSVQQQLVEYFSSGRGRDIRSFISMPLDRQLGVLNVHANRPDILGPRIERRETFRALITPVLQDLADAVGHLVRLDARSLRTPSDDATIGQGGAS